MPSTPPLVASVAHTQPNGQEENTFDAVTTDHETDPNAEHGIEPERELSGTYLLLSEPFAITFTDIRGGVPLTYISGEQVASRLNTVLGPGSWSFTVPREGYDDFADAYWCLGHLEAVIDGQRCVREQYGAAKVKRPTPPCGYVYPEGSVRVGSMCMDRKYEHDRRHNDHAYIEGPIMPPLNIGYDKKASATDAFKKCASGLGVGLYLSARVATPDGKGKSAATVQRPANPQGRPTTGGNGGGPLTSRQNANSQPRSSSSPSSHPTASGSRAERHGAIARATTTGGTTGPATSTPAGAPGPTSAGGDPRCVEAECGAPIEKKVFTNGEWSVDQLRQYSREKFDGKEYCYPHFKEHLDAKNAAQGATAA